MARYPRTHRPTPDQIKAAAGETVPDVIARGLTVLFCGINPGLYTAAVGHHFARPGNRFWRALFEAGFTDRQFAPEQERELLSLGYGITNLVERATATAAELKKEELIAGSKRLEEKVLRFAPEWLAVVGIGAYRTAFNRPRALFGLQPESFGNCKVWVLPNPSGLNAHFSPKGLAQVFQELRLTVESQQNTSLVRKTLPSRPP
jgi:TDG/mug DNA glycosylase family protein